MDFTIPGETYDDAAAINIGSGNNLPNLNVDDMNKFSRSCSSHRRMAEELEKDMFWIIDRLSLVFTDGVPTTDLDAVYFCLDTAIQYHSFCDDFGPMNLGAIYRFCLLVDKQLHDFPGASCRLCATRSDHSATTNVVFLLGAYMIMRCGCSMSEVAKALGPLEQRLLTFRDVSSGPQNFHLSVHDCLQGLLRGKSLGWVDFAEDGFDLEEYEELDSPVNADLHEVVNGKFIAMRGPKDLSGGGQRWRDEPGGGRDFTPEHYAEILEQFDVTAVIRLNAPDYDAAGLEARGIAVVDMPFDDCTAPTPAVVAQFLMFAEGLPGPIAVHCKAGLGRTGTLIALYMMKHHGFTAREAIGWLRIVRPGSVIGPQQEYLCRMEAAAHSAGEVFRARGPAVSLRAAGVAGVQQLLADVQAAVERRIRSAPSAGCSGAKAGRGAEDGGPVDAERAELLAAHVTAVAARRSMLRQASWPAMR